MSVPTTFEALVIVALIFVPGFLFIQLIRRSVSHVPESSDARFFLAIGGTGLLLHVIVFSLGTDCVVEWYRNGTIDQHLLATNVWAFLVLFVWPVIAGVAVSSLVKIDWVDGQLDRIGLGSVDRTPSAWDWAVDVDESRWLKIYLRDGKIIGGRYGTESFASLYSPQRDIFLEEMWLVDASGTLTEQVVNTDGVWIAHDMISHIVFQIGVD